MKIHPKNSLWIRVPASTANLGPGFDALALALKLYNYVAVTPGKPDLADPFVEETVDAYHQARKLRAQAYRLTVHAHIPRSRGLGSSATIRLGLLAALDQHYGRKLDLPWLIENATALEGHPDNITAAALGGFVVCGGKNPTSTKISRRLKFVAAIPQTEASTKTARSLLPSQVPLADAVTNLRNVARITSAFSKGRYEEAVGAFHDCLHQPYRASLVPGLAQAILQAQRAGAIGAFLSGAGPTVMAITTQSANKLGQAMKKALLQAHHASVEVKILLPDNDGLKIVRKLPRS